ncbi:MAG: YlbF family regulator [Clostridiales bacterium]|nr:YlbF family regulator [Clostridiales bacterium]
MTQEMIKAIHELGNLIKSDGASERLNHAVEDYERCEELMNLIAEYNTQQELMASSVDADASVREKINDRIDELYNKVTSHPVYLEYGRAKSEFDALYGEVIEELQFAVTGQRPCSHDCSSCGGCH